MSHANESWINCSGSSTHRWPAKARWSSSPAKRALARPPWVTEFARRAQDAHPDLLVAIGNCNAQTGIGDPYLPFREVLGLLTGDVEAKLAQGAITQENAHRLRDFLRVSGQALVEVGPDLIGIFVPGAGLVAKAGTFVAGKVGWLDRLEELTARKAAAAGGPGLQQSRLFEQYTDVLQALAGQRPLMVVVDDLQWADVSSISLLFHLGRRMGESRVLILGAYRPEDVAFGRADQPHPLEGVLSEFKRYYGDVWLDLARAAEAEGREFVDTLLDTEPNRLGEAFRQALFRHTGGHPLFTIELLRDMQERGDLVQDDEGRWVEGLILDWGTLPARVEGVIEKRIGRLEAELREALTVASVEGEDFTAEVVARVQALDERGLVQRLSSELDKQHRLVGARGIRRVDSQRLSLYRFRHNLFQRYLYNSLDEVERVYLHEDVGNVLEVLYGDQTEGIAVQLARHFQEAEIAEKAIHYLHQAGDRAHRLSANEEAIAHFRRGLALLKASRLTPERPEQELALQMSLALSLMNLNGYSDAEAGQACARARELCEQIREAPKITTVLGLLSAHHFARAEYGRALELAEQLLHVALKTKRRRRLSLVVSNYIHATIYLGMGELDKGLKHAEQAIANYSPHLDGVAIQEGGLNAGVGSRCFAASILQLSGYSDQSRQRLDEATALAQDDPYNLAWALFYLALVSKLRRDVQKAQGHTRELVTLTTEYGFRMFRAFGIILQGWTMAMHGRAAEGLVHVRRGLAMQRAKSTENYRSFCLCLLAEVCNEAGQIEQGLAALNEGIAFVERTGERFCEAEIHRLRGELLLKVEGGAMKTELSPEVCFLKAIEVARQQNARLWELRATVSLCCLWQQQGKREEARQLLVEVYGWFTEGFDTPDLKEAKALLDALS